MVQPEGDRIRTLLAKITASKVFSGSERLCRFLRFTVEAKLTNQDQLVKEYVLGREVFDRMDDYDPRLDPIVRVEARRLRSKLAQYYAGPGRADPIRLAYPKGSYLPEFQTGADAVPLRRASAKLRFVVAAAAIALIAVALVAYRATTSAPQMIAVLPAQWVWHGKDFDVSGIGIAEILSGDLANSQKAHVVAWPVVAQHRDARMPLRDLAADLRASRLLVVSVRPLDGVEKSVAVFLVDPATGEKRAAQRYVRSDVASYSSQAALAEEITRRFVAR